MTMLLDTGWRAIMLLPIHSRCSRILGNHKGAWHLHEGTAVLDLEVKNRRQLQACRCHQASCKTPQHQTSHLLSHTLASTPGR